MFEILFNHVDDSRSKDFLKIEYLFIILKGVKCSILISIKKYIFLYFFLS